MAETTAWRSHCQFITFITFLFRVNVIRQMAPLFSKVDSNKLWRDVQSEENVICAKFGKDLFSISKVIGRKKVAQFFLTHSVYMLCMLYCIIAVLANVRYLDISLRLLTFDGTPSHPAHIRQLVHSHLTVLHLTQILRAQTSIATSRVFVYPDRAADTEPLPEDQSLEQCGFTGGPRGMPTPVLLYYDYLVDIGSGCPLIMCDHYFGQRKARVHRSTSELPVAGPAGSKCSSVCDVSAAGSSHLPLSRKSSASYLTV